MVDSVAEMVTAQAARTPDAIALVHGERTVTYAELDARANALAHGLAGETRVGVCCERSPEMIVAVLAILKAGAAYVPLDPALPATRRALIVADAGLRTVIARGDVGDARAATAPRVAHGGERAMFALYTSGSTGEPKGVVCCHAAVANRLRWQQAAYPFAPGEIAAARTPLGFVDSVAEIFAPLAFGVPLVVLGDAAQRDVAAGVVELARTGATRIVIVPSLLATLLDVVPDLAARVPRLHYWFVGGEPVAVPLVERFFRALPGRKLINIYGATELTADATYYDFDAMPPGLATAPIGVPLPGVHARIVDDELREVRDGEAGEICISGACLARGYLDRPVLTDERFVANPFPEGGKLYRTRDRGRRLPSGDIQYLGRLDHLVKIRGLRVELGEIEAVVAAVPGVTGAAAVAKDEQLLAFYTAERALSARELRAAVAERVTVVPDRFTHVDRFPLTPSGKIDRAALAAMPVKGRAALPLDAAEQRVAEIWHAILGEPVVSPDDDFFELGGTSLGAMRVAAKLAEGFGVHVPVAAVFEQPTVAALARWLAAAQPARVRPAPAVTDRPLPARLPLSQYQFPFWMYRALTGDNSIVADVFAIAGPVDLPRLQRAFDRTVASFDALWMRYPRFAPVQELAPRGPCRFELGGDGADHTTRPFDLMKPPHVHARLCGNRLLLAIPHIAGDMSSLELFRATLEAHYTGSAPPSRGASLLDLVEWERGLAAADTSYWLAIAGGPASNPVPARLFTRERVRAWSSRPLPLAALDRYARNHGLSTPLALIGGLYAALAHVAEVADPTVLVMTEKRDRAELRELFTNLTGVMPCRIANGRAALDTVVGEVARRLLASAEHSDALMRRPTLWNDFWAHAPRARRLVSSLGSRLARRWPVERDLIAEYIFALVPAFERRANRLIFAINVMPEIMQRTTGCITRDRELPDMLKPGDLITNGDALLARTLQIHVTNARAPVVNLYGGGLAQHALDEINDRIAATLGALA